MDEQCACGFEKNLSISEERKKGRTQEKDKRRQEKITERKTGKREVRAGIGCHHTF